MRKNPTYAPATIAIAEAQHGTGPSMPSVSSVGSTTASLSVFHKRQPCGQRQEFEDDEEAQKLQQRKRNHAFLDVLDGP